MREELRTNAECPRENSARIVRGSGKIAGARGKSAISGETIINWNGGESSASLCTNGRFRDSVDV